MVGQTISHHRVAEKLSQAGMGVVYKAEDTKLDRPVVPKFLATRVVSGPEACKRLKRSLSRRRSPTSKRSQKRA